MSAVGKRERGGRIGPDATDPTPQAATLRTVKDGATSATEVRRSYSLLERRGFTHVAVKHGQRKWSVFDVQTQEMHHTNGIESFWELFNDSIRGTRISVSRTMKRNLDDVTFYANRREEANLMIDRLVAAF